MSEIIYLDDRRRKEKKDKPPESIKRIVDGELIEYVLCESGTLTSNQ